MFSDCRNKKPEPPTTIDNRVGNPGFRHSVAAYTIVGFALLYFKFMPLHGISNKSIRISAGPIVDYS